MFTLNVASKGQYIGGLPTYEGPVMDLGFQFAGEAATGNFKFVRFRLVDTTCTMDFSAGTLAIDPGTSSIPASASSQSFTYLYGLVVTRPGDAGTNGSIIDQWFHGASAAALAIQNDGFCYSVFLQEGMSFPVRTVTIETGTDGTVDVMVIGR